MPRKALIALAVCGLGVGLAGPSRRPGFAQPAPGIVTPEGRVVIDGSVARREYMLRDDVGAVFDAGTEGEPGIFTQGEHQIIVALERAVAEMGCREDKEVRESTVLLDRQPSSPA